MATDILVTGGSGFIGTRLVQRLRDRGQTVQTFSAEDGDIATAELDIAAKHVFHLAARTFVPESWEAPKSFYHVNVMGTANVLDFCRRTGASITLISSYVYGHPQRLPIDEDHPVGAFNPYGHTKLLCEELARFFAEKFRVRTSVIRPFNIYGPGQAAQFLIPAIVSQALTADEIRLGDLRPKRDYLYVDDFIDLLIATLDANTPGTYNAGSGESFSAAEVAAMVQRAAGTNKPVISSGTPRPDDVLDVRADTTRARRDLGWSARTPLDRGIEEVVKCASRT